MLRESLFPARFKEERERKLEKKSGISCSLLCDISKFSIFTQEEKGVTVARQLRDALKVLSFVKLLNSGHTCTKFCESGYHGEGGEGKG